MSLAVRTMTALWTSPFLTLPRGAASLTETTMMSPTPATRRLDPPSTLMHWTRLAPELSATSRLDCIWIIVQSFLCFGGFGRGGFGLALGCFRRGGGRSRLGRPGDIDFGKLVGCHGGSTDPLDHGPALQLGDRGALFDAHL